MQFCHTTAPIEKHFFEWTISDVEFLGSVVHSSNFPTNPKGSKSTYFLTLNTRGKSSANSSYYGTPNYTNMELQLCVNASQGETHGRYPSTGGGNGGSRVTLIAAIVDAGGEHKNAAQSDNNGGLKVKFPSITTLESQNLLPGGNLKIYCEVWEISKEKTQIVGRTTKKSSSNLARDLGKLFEQQQDTDVTLCVGKKSYRAHKIILSARSPVFCAMFQHNMKEVQSNRVDIEDVEYEVLLELIKYIYTGKSDKIKEMADKLFRAADKYAVEDLKIECGNELCKTVLVENAVDYLILADQANAIQLKAVVLKFIVAYLAQVRETNSWNKILSYPTLLDEILDCSTQTV